MIVYRQRKVVERVVMKMRLALIKYRGKNSQQKMAEKYNVSQQAWSKWEKGTATPSPSIMLLLEKDSGIKMEQLFFDVFQQPIVVDKTKKSA